MVDKALRFLRSAVKIDKSLNWGREIVRETSRDLNLSGQSIVVDVGAGLGYDLSIIHSEYPLVTCHAIDYLEDRRTYFEHRGMVYHSINIEHESFPFSTSSVDLIIINQVLEHCKELFWIFHEVSRVLRIGGHVLIGVPNLASLHNRILLLFGMQPTCIQVGSAHIRGFTHAGLCSFVVGTAPQVYVQTKFVGGNFYPFPRAIARFLSHYLPNLSVSIFVVFRKTGNYSGEFLVATDGLETNFRISQ